MTLKKVLLALAAIPVSIFLAMLTEALALEHNFINATPGMWVAHRIFPPGTGGLESIGKKLSIEVSIDAPILFFLICGTAFLVSKLKRDRKAWISKSQDEKAGEER